MRYTIPNKPYTQMNRGERRAFKRWVKELKKQKETKPNAVLQS